MRLNGFILPLLLVAAHGAAAQQPVPAPPPVAATAYYVMDFQSGQMIAGEKENERVEPASITKLMTAYIAFSAIENGNLALDEEVTVSNKAYRAEGSRMFIEERKKVSVENLLIGMIVQSGNDASIALAEHIAGSEETFAELMNQYAVRLGMENSRYMNVTGLPSDGHYATPRDIALLTAALIREFPEFYRWYSQREFTYNEITQYNRNTLLWRDDSVDGVKTGHTDSAGYCLVASAERDGMRLISVVMGTNSETARADASQALLNYGFRFYETHLLYGSTAEISTARVWKGASRDVSLGVREQIYVTIPRGQYDALRAEMDLQTIIVAPVATDVAVGSVRVSLGDTLLKTSDLYPLQPVAAGNLLRRAADEIRLWFE